MRLVLFVTGLLFILVPSQAQAELFTDELTGTRYSIELYVQANFPVGMAFAPDGRLFYNEKTTGNVRVVSAGGVLQPTPVINLPTDALQERGMLGLALDPDFENNSLLYVVHTVMGNSTDFPANRLVRFRIDDNNRGQDLQELLRLPIENGLLLHNGGNIHFDNEGFLYLSFGDYGEAANAQNLNTQQAAIHRFRIDEGGNLSIPADNPFGPENSIFAYGLRNPFDFTFDPISNHLFASESGPNCDDEINLVQAGANYGWDENYECVGRAVIPGLENYAAPLLTFTPPISPTGIVVYDDAAFPGWQGDLFFCNWNFGSLQRAILNETRSRIESVHEIDLGALSCRIDLTVGPDGALYFGTVDIGEGAILRLLPVD